MRSLTHHTTHYSESVLKSNPQNSQLHWIQLLMLEFCNIFSILQQQVIWTLIQWKVSLPFSKGLAIKYFPIAKLVLHTVLHILYSVTGISFSPHEVIYKLALITLLLLNKTNCSTFSLYFHRMARKDWI